MTPPWKPVLQMQHLHVAVRNFHFTQQLPTLFSEIFRQISLYLVTVPKSAVLNLHISFSLHCCEDDLYTSRYSGVGTKKISKSIDQGNTILHGETLTVESLWVWTPFLFFWNNCSLKRASPRKNNRLHLSESAGKSV